MVDLPGAVGSVQDEEATMLATFAFGRDVLEVGSYVGKSTVAMAQVANRVVSIDWHQGGHPDYQYPHSLGIFMENLETYGVTNRVIAMVGRSEHILPLLAPGQFDFAFIDATHTYDGTLGDLIAVAPLIRRHGQIACHDYLDLWNKGFEVGAAVRAFCAKGGWRAVDPIVRSTVVLERVRP